MKRVLVAGLGNIFLGDDAFGIEVAARLMSGPLPRGVEVGDFGIRALDLAYVLQGDEYDAAVLVDVAQRGGEPGTLYVIDPGDDADGQDFPQSPHDLGPDAVLAMLRSQEGGCRLIRLVACEPRDFGEADAGRMGLSPVLAATVAAAARLVLNVVRELCEDDLSRTRVNEVELDASGGVR
jgi:hydrogenase maturation protease